MHRRDGVSVEARVLTRLHRSKPLVVQCLDLIRFQHLLHHLPELMTLKQLHHLMPRQGG